MIDTLMTLFSYPFMQRALISGMLVAALVSVLGVFATLRRMAFFGDGIAHASLTGIAIAILVGAAPLPVALIWAVIIATILYRAERSTRLPSDTVLGILFTASMALGVVIMSFTRGYQPELLTYLFGSILAIQTSEVWLTAALAAIVLTWVVVCFRPLSYLSLAQESAEVAGVHVRTHLYVLYIALACATVIAAKTLGIALVSALIVLPAATGRQIASTFKGTVIAAIVSAEFSIIAGLIASYFFDIPSGASIVLAGTILFIGASLIKHD